MINRAWEKHVSEGDVLRLYDRLLRYWSSQPAGRAETADLVHEGIGAILQKAHKWRGESSLLTFLTAVGKNAGLDYLRKQRRRERFIRHFEAVGPELNEDNNPD